jgi:alkyl hydroperoxide reductase subunit AhpC
MGMNEQQKSKHLRGVSIVDASGRARAIIGTKRAGCRRQSTERNNPLAVSAPQFHPARGLMICLGWLRLFQAIVAGTPSARKPISHET